MRNYNRPQTILDVFTTEECEKIIKLGKAQDGLVDGPVFREKDGRWQQTLDKGFRLARNWVLPEDGAQQFDWIRQRLWDASRKINESYFEFELEKKYPDRVAFVHYPSGGFFQPHVDNLGDRDGLFKKLTCVVQLSAPDSYEGGLLQHSSVTEDAPRTQGCMIVFPSYLRHFVTEITKGDRYILVNWCQSYRHFR